MCSEPDLASRIFLQIFSLLPSRSLSRGFKYKKILLLSLPFLQSILISMSISRQVSIGSPSKADHYPVVTGQDAWKEALLKQFPEEEKAIEKFFKLLKVCSPFSQFSLRVCVPVWFDLAYIGLRTNIVPAI